MTVWHDLPDLDTSHLFDGDELEQEQDEEMPPEAPAAAQDASDDCGRWGSTYAIDDAICELLQANGQMTQRDLATQVSARIGCARITVDRRLTTIRSAGIIWVGRSRLKNGDRFYGCRRSALAGTNKVLADIIDAGGVITMPDLSRRMSNRLLAGYYLTRLVRSGYIERDGKTYYLKESDYEPDEDVVRREFVPMAKSACMVCNAETFDCQWHEARRAGWDQHFIFDEIEPMITCSDGCRDRTINSPQWLKSQRLTSIGAGFYRRLNMNITPDTIVEIIGDNELTAAQIAEHIPDDIANKPARIGRNLGMARKAGKIERSPDNPEAWRKAKQAAEKKVDTSRDGVLDLPESIVQYCSTDELRAYRKVRTTALIIAGDVASIRLAAEILSEK